MRRSTLLWLFCAACDSQLDITHFDHPPPDLANNSATSNDAGATNRDAGAINGGKPVALLAPTWSRLLPSLELGNSAAWAPDGTLVAEVSAFSDAPGQPVTLGAGEPGQVSLGSAEPALLWLDGSTGQILRGRAVAGRSSSDPGDASQWFGQLWPALTVSDIGTVTLARDFRQKQLIFPGTAEETQQSAVTAAVDPFVVRYGSDGSAEWVMRGITPAPLGPTGANNTVTAIADTPDRGMFVTGFFSVSNFSLARGPISLAFTQPVGSFFARLDSTGAPIWEALNKNSQAGDFGGWSAVVDAGNDAYATLAFSGTETLFADSSTPLVLTAPLPTASVPTPAIAVVKISNLNHVDWVRVFLGSFTVTANGTQLGLAADGVLLATQGTGPLTMTAADGTVLASPPANGSWVAKLTSDGALAWFDALGEGVVVGGGPVVDSSGNPWLASSVPLAGVIAPVAPPTGATSWMVLQELGVDGSPKRAFIAGSNLQPSSLSISGGKLALAMGVTDTTGVTLAGASGLAPLPSLPASHSALLLSLSPP